MLDLALNAYSSLLVGYLLCL